MTIPSAHPLLVRLATHLEQCLAMCTQEKQRYIWHKMARDSQLIPSGNDWRVWLILAGRGFGKTRTGAETIRQWVETKKCSRIALVGETERDVRDVMIQGESGLLNIHPEETRPTYRSSLGLLTWPCGAQANVFSNESYEKLRGPQFDGAWVDELAKFSYAQETWDQLMFGLRLGKNPRVVVTTTPRPHPLLRQLMNDEMTVVTRGNTYENAKNLAAPFLDQILKRYEGSRLGAQEIHAELLDDLQGALWRRDLITHKYIYPENLKRIVIGVDPATTAKASSDETGIIVAGQAMDGTGHILADLSGTYGPGTWARHVVNAYHLHKADRVVAETNAGGDMIAHMLREIDPTIAFKSVTARRGKIMRAEPILALYEQKRIFHQQHFSKLEEQMCTFTAESKKSPDRMDALVWALTDLFFNKKTAPKIWVT